jgi:GDP-L-fucose synthase
MTLPDDKFDTLIGTGSGKSEPPLINIGCGDDLAVSELAELVRGVVRFPGDIDWDPSKPDGTPRKLLDVSRLSALGWKPRISLGEGIARAYEDFLCRYAR